MYGGSEVLVSIIMGIYFTSRNTTLVQRSIMSVLGQTYKTLELVICDDGSTAEVKAFVDQCAKVDERVVVVRQKCAYSLPQKLNLCLAHASGRLIARMDDDDFSHPERLEQQVAFLMQHPEIDFVACNVNVVQGGQTVGSWCFPEYPSVRDFYMVQPFIHPALIFRKEALIEAGGYSEDKFSVLCEDYDLLLRLYAVGKQGANLQTVLFDYTIPVGPDKKRKFHHRINEAVTRYRRFKELKVLPQAWIFVLKPIVVGCIPSGLLVKLKEMAHRKA